MAANAKARNDEVQSKLGVAAKEIGAEHMAGPPKTAERILRKAVDDYGTGADAVPDPVMEVKDSTRATFKVDDPAGQLAAIREAVGKQFEITRVKNGYNDVHSAAGYKDIKLNFRNSDGSQSELIIATPEMLDAKEHRGGHALYVKTQDTQLPPAEVLRLNGEMQALYRDAERRTAERLARSRTGAA